MFIQTPQDFFWLVTATVILLVGVLLAFATFYLIILLKQSTEILGLWRKKIEQISDIAGLVREKLMAPSAWVAGLGAALMQGLKIAKKMRKKDQ